MRVSEPQMLQFLLYSTVEGWRLQADGESRLLDHAPDSRSERRVGGETFEFGMSVEEEHDLHTLQGRLERRRLGEVSLHQLHVAAEQVACSLWIAHEGLEGHTRLGEQPDQRSSDVTGRAGYQDHPRS
jgi:hypothetical protein